MNPALFAIVSKRFAHITRLHLASHAEEKT